MVDTVRGILTVLDAATTEQALDLPQYRLHPLKGDRSGDWAMTVSRNWRMTFRKIDERTIGDLDLEDYH